MGLAYTLASNHLAGALVASPTVNTLGAWKTLSFIVQTHNTPEDFLYRGKYYVSVYFAYFT